MIQLREIVPEDQDTVEMLLAAMFQERVTHYKILVTHFQHLNSIHVALVLLLKNFKLIYIYFINNNNLKFSVLELKCTHSSDCK